MDLRRIIILSFMLLGGSVGFSQTAQSLVELGHKNYELGDYAEAIKYLNQAAELDKKDPEIFYLIGVCESQSQNNEAAIQNYNIALALDPTYAEVYFEKGYSLFVMGKLEEAIEQYDESIKLKADNAVAFVNRGSLKCILGDKEGAMKDWQRAEELGASIPEQECDT